MLKGYQTVDKGYAILANNEIVGDYVIVPPANSVDMIKKKKEQKQAGEIECLDWRLYHERNIPQLSSIK